MTTNFFSSPFNTENVLFQQNQDDAKSYKEHNAQYQQIDLTKEIQRQLDNTNRITQYTENAPLGLAIDKSKDIEIAIDIGSGTGWASNLLSQTKSIVYAIEPSLAAINVAKKIYPNNNKIVWTNGFAEKELQKIISLDKSVLFNSLCVLSHLRDNIVIEICKQINRLALEGSILSFSECYGVDFSDGNLWHSRTENWWKERFPGWKFDFCGKEINHPKGCKKNFLSFKI